MPDPEQLDLAPATSPRRPWLLLVALVVALVAVSAVVAWPRGDRTAPDPEPSTNGSPPATPSAPSSTSRRPSRPASPSTQAVRPIDGFPADLRLLTTTPVGLVAFAPATGETLTLPLDRQEDYGGSGSVVPTPDGVFWQRSARSAYVVDNTGVTRVLAAEPTAERVSSVAWYAGPNATWPLWRVDPILGQVSVMDLTGRTRQVDVPAALAHTIVGSDGRGGLVATGPDGTSFVITLGGVHRLSSASVVAIGPTVLLTVRCDADADCWYEVVDRSGLASPRRLPGSVLPGASGLVSPDGTLAVLHRRTPSATELVVIELDTGSRRLDDALQDATVNQLTWSPDSDWVAGSVWVNGTGATRTPLILIDAVHGGLTVVDLPVPDAGGIAFDPYDRTGWA